MTNTFTSRLEVDEIQWGKLWRLTEPLDYVDLRGQTIRVPKGFKTDFASIPNLSMIAGLALGLCFLIGKLFPVTFNIVFPLGVFAWVVVLIAEQFLHDGNWDAAVALHDYIFQTRCRTFWQANWILFRAMGSRSCPTGRTPLWKRLLIFGGVTVGGWWAWCDDWRRIKNN